MTYKIVMAAGQDAGNRSMKRAGRISWNEEDWNVAAEVTARLLQFTEDGGKREG